MSSLPTRVRNRLLLPAMFLAGIGSAIAGGDRAAAWSGARQMVVVVVPDWNAAGGTLRTYAREGGAWRPAGIEAPVTIGRDGAAWGAGLGPAQADGPQKREGDDRSPAGVFRIGTAFGYAPTASTAWPYRALGADDYCVDVGGSPLYNRIVDAREVGAAAVKGSTEPMRRDLHVHGDQRYKLGFVIEHNAEGRKGMGSCIFGHLWKSPTDATAGCTAMAEPVMRALLAWLDPKRRPVFVLLPAREYARLAAAWGLPPARK